MAEQRKEQPPKTYDSPETYRQINPNTETRPPAEREKYEYKKERER
jgi:hypothetical protein